MCRYVRLVILGLSFSFLIVSPAFSDLSCGDLELSLDGNPGVTCYTEIWALGEIDNTGGTGEVCLSLEDAPAKYNVINESILIYNSGGSDYDCYELTPSGKDADWYLSAERSDWGSWSYCTVYVASSEGGSPNCNDVVDVDVIWYTTCGL